MGNGLISFLGGLGHGGLNEYRRQQAQERQDKRDAAIERMNDLRAQAAQMQIDAATEAKNRETEFRESLKDVTPEQGFAVGDAFTKDAGAADVMADMAAQPPGEEPGQEVAPAPVTRAGGKLFGGNDGGLGAATAYAGERNSRSRADRWFDERARLFPEQEIAIREQQQKYQQMAYDSGRSLIFQQGMQAIQGGNVAALSDLAKPYLSGGNLSFAPATGGGWTAIVTNKEGQQVAQQPIKNTQELETLWYSQVFPDKVAAQRAETAKAQLQHERQVDLERSKARFGIARDSAKGFDLAPGATRYDGRGRVVASNPKDRDEPWSDRAIANNDEFKGRMSALNKQLSDQMITPDQYHAEVGRLRSSMREGAVVTSGANALRSAIRGGSTPQQEMEKMVADGVPEGRIKSVFAAAGIEIPASPVKSAPTAQRQANPAPRTAPKQPPAPAAPPVDPVGQRLDAARAARADARAKLNRYGLRQRRDDPDGYVAAKALLQETEAALREAESAYRQALPAGSDKVFTR